MMFLYQEQAVLKRAIIRKARHRSFGVRANFSQVQEIAGKQNPKTGSQRISPQNTLKTGAFSGAGSQTRTDDLRITNALLYRLSYTQHPNALVGEGHYTA